MNRFGSKGVVRRIAAALVLSAAPLVAVERAEAACSPDPLVNNATATCTDATANQSGNNGYGTGAETGVTINVDPTAGTTGTATVTGTSIGIAIGDGTINNAGTISGGSDGLFLSGTVNNSGSILSATGIGIFVGGATRTVNNSATGTISAGSDGIGSGNNLTVTNAGVIEATGTGGVAIAPAGSSLTLTNSSTGVIRSNQTGGFAVQTGDTPTISNAGTIEANGTGGVAVQGANMILSNTDGTNPGTISANGQNGVAIKGDTGGGISGSITVTSNPGTISAGMGAGNTGGIAIDASNTAGTATVASSGTIQASSIAIVTNGLLTLDNTGSVTSTGIFAVVSNNGDVKVNQNVTGNTGTITAAAAGGIAIQAAGTATVANVGNGTTTGIISASDFAISGTAINVTANTGLIESIVGNAIDANSVTVNSSGTIRANGASVKTILAISDATVTNSGTIQANGTGGTAIFDAAGTATVNNLSGGTIAGNTFGISARTLVVTNAAGASISGDTAIQGAGSVTSAGTITGTTASVQFTGTGTNSLALQTGAVLNGAARGASGAINKLFFEGHGSVSNSFTGFNTLDVDADTAWIWNTNAAIDLTNVNTGTFVVDAGLSGTVAVNAGGVLAGHGTVAGPLIVAGGTVAPGAAVPFSTLTVNGNVNFQPNSIYRVNVNAAGQHDVLQMAGVNNTIGLTGGTVNVLAQNGAYAPSTKYTILTAEGGGLGGSNTFAGVTSNLAFLTPTLTYDAKDVFLTLMTNGTAGGGFGFVSAAQTRNQLAVAGALDASPVSSSLVTALLNQTANGARAAFDALSGELFGSVHNTQGQEASSTRSAILGRLRQASYADVPSELGVLGFAGPELAYGGDDASAARDAYAAMPGKASRRADDRSRGLTFWAQGLGGWGHADSDGNAASLKSRFGGFLSGVDARYGDTLRAGLVAGYTRSDLNVAERSSSAGIDSVQFGGYAGGRFGALNVRGGASYSYDSIDTSRTIAFPGFSDQTKAHFHGDVGQVFGEIGHGMALGHVAFEPFAGLAYVHLRDGSFLESGGVAALSGSRASENIGYSSLGLRAATAVPLANGTVLVPRASLQWQYAFGDVATVSALAFQSTGAGFTAAGIPIARNSALVEAGFDWRFSPWAKLGAFYQGELAAHAQSHAFKGAFTWNF
jgi:fibronectin-binding autotransporter adhesin